MAISHPKIYFIRHGETDWNAQGLIQGTVNTDLNATGIAQALAVARALTRFEPELRSYEFAASPQLRAQHTMRIVCDLQPRDFRSVRSDARLRELGFGVWEGQDFRRLHQDPSYPTDPAHHYHWCPPGGESYADGVARVDAFVRSLMGPTVIVAHGAIGRCLIGYLCNIPRIDITHLPTPQGSYCILENGRHQWIDTAGQPVP